MVPRLYGQHFFLQTKCAVSLSSAMKPEASKRYHDELRGAALKPQVLKHGKHLICTVPRLA